MCVCVRVCVCVCVRVFFRARVWDRKKSALYLFVPSPPLTGRVYTNVINKDLDFVHFPPSVPFVPFSLCLRSPSTYIGIAREAFDWEYLYISLCDNVCPHFLALTENRNSFMCWICIKLESECVYACVCVSVRVYVRAFIRYIITMKRLDSGPPATYPTGYQHKNFISFLFLFDFK